LCAGGADTPGHVCPLAPQHFIYFNHCYQLIDKRELAPLQDLVDKIV